MMHERTIEADRQDTQAETGRVEPAGRQQDVSRPTGGALPPQAVGAAAIGALAVGAFAIGALAIGRLAIGRLRVGRFHGRRLRIDELEIGRLRVGELVRPGAERVKRRYLRNE